MASDLYVVSKSGNHRFALMEGNMIEVCYGVDPFGQARSIAVEHTKAMASNAFIYRVTLDLRGTTKSVTEVVYEPTL